MSKKPNYWIQCAYFSAIASLQILEARYMCLRPLLYGHIILKGGGLKLFSQDHPLSLSWCTRQWLSQTALGSAVANIEIGYIGQHISSSNTALAAGKDDSQAHES